MFVLLSQTMKTLFFLTYMCLLLPVQPEDMNRYIYCESCLTAAQEIEKSLTDVAAESRGKAVKNLISGRVCEKLRYHKHDHISNDKLMSSCTHLFESHHDKFQAALVNKEPKNLEIVLCYEQSTACVGVKRMSFKDSKTTFTESDLDALLRENKENVRIAKPTYSGSPAQSRDEL